jgi:glutaredoxin
MIRYVHNYLKYSMWCREDYEELLDNQIKNSDVLIVGLSWCPWTVRAKRLLADNYPDIDPVILAPDIINNHTKLELLYCLSKKVNTTYIPQIWVKGQHIGDFEHLYKMHHRGQINI